MIVLIELPFLDKTASLKDNPTSLKKRKYTNINLADPNRYSNSIFGRHIGRDEVIGCPNWECARLCYLSNDLGTLLCSKTFEDSLGIYART
jgi:hypothetical protein